jgi:hypothetical protein
MKAGVWGGGVKVEKYISDIQCCSGEIFFKAKKRILFVDDDSGLNLYDDSRCSSLAD